MVTRPRRRLERAGVRALRTFAKTIRSLSGKQKLGVAGSVALGIAIIQRYRRAARVRHERSAEEIAASDKRKAAAAAKKKGRVAVDMAFISRFRRFLPIIIPGLRSKEGGTMLAILALLLIRSFLDLWMIKNNASVVASITSRDYESFLFNVGQFLLMQFPTSGVNNLLKYCISTLQLLIRKRLTLHMHEQYLKGNTYYSVSNVDSRIENADQLLTQDIQRFADSFGTLYSNITKPMFDCIVFFVKLVNKFGFTGPTTMLTYFIVAGALMTKLRTPFGKFSAVEQELEGDFRAAHARVITYSEEIAFYNGEAREKALINKSLFALVKHVRKYLNFRFVLGLFDSCVTKYTATSLAYFIVSAPLFDHSNDHKYKRELGGDPTRIMRDYTSYVRLLFSMVTAIGRLIDAGRELSRFAGYTSRVWDLAKVLKEVSSGTYERTMITQKNEDGDDVAPYDLNNQQGVLIEEDTTPPRILFDKVPVVTPNGDLLVKSLTFTIESGMNCLVCGGNGTGKSSMFRILAKLWPLFSGVIRRPTGRNLFYIPQKPYLTPGTLRDQIIYPHNLEEARANGKSDEDIMELMKIVNLEYIVEREGGWDTVHDWTDVLSGGEKQRVAMARLFYHRPQFAILDECTSATSVDVEGKMYQYCRDSGITLFTVSHRKSLWKYHDYKLFLDGQGGYTFGPIDDGEEEFGS